MSTVQFSLNPDSITPGIRSIDVAISDTQDLVAYPKFLYINSDGIIEGILLRDDDTEVRQYRVFAGQYLALEAGTLKLRVPAAPDSTWKWGIKT